MNQSYAQLDKNNSTWKWNVVRNLANVKSAVNKFCQYSLGVIVGAVLLAAPLTTHAMDDNSRAIVNSTELLNFLSGVVPEGMPHLMENLQNGKIKRVAPNYPVWIINSESGNLLYYQGQKSFTGQPASRLVDDNGFRFGQRALDMALNSRSTWLRIVLGGQTYSAYCGSKAPFVVCSLIQPH